VKVTVAGRPWVFHRRDFITEEEESQVERQLVEPELNPKMKAKPAGVALVEEADDLPF
jgi:hypothetical protein